MPISRPPALRLAAFLLAAFFLAALPGCDAATIQIGDPGGDTPLADAESKAGTWTWVPVEDAKCRDGSSTGFGARLQKQSAKLLVYLEGGGACFNGATCSKNVDDFGRNAFAVVAGSRGKRGLFDTSRKENPVAGWNAAYVPYCTGDVHAGSARDVRVDGVDADGDGTPDAQQFVGHLNVERYLSILSEHFAGKVDQVLLTGSSAGGFGTLVNYEAVRDAFPDARVTLLDDSGPPVASDAVLTPQLEQRWQTLWDIEAALSPSTATAVEKEGLAAIYDRLAHRFPSQTFGLLSHRRDATIRDFYGYGHADCPDPERCVSGAAYARALADVRRDAPAWGTYYAGGSDHTFLASGRFYDTTVSGTALTDWMQALLAGDAQDVAP